MNIHSLYARISPRFRRRRLRWFLEELALQPDERVLDVGGTRPFWTEAQPVPRVTLLNIVQPDRRIAGFDYVTGDGCALPWSDREFAVVFSNSVIEHVGSWERQQMFAAEARRVGRKLWVQTPAREFFIEPHLIAPFVHWLPRSWQRRLIRPATVWGWLTRPTPERVDGFLAEVRLLTRMEMERLFPDCEILTERFLGMPKSYIAVRRG